MRVAAVRISTVFAEGHERAALATLGAGITAVAGSHNARRMLGAEHLHQLTEGLGVVRRKVHYEKRNLRQLLLGRCGCGWCGDGWGDVHRVTARATRAAVRRRRE